MVLFSSSAAVATAVFFSYVGKYWSTALSPHSTKDWVALETFDMKTRIEWTSTE